jgi:predicted ArsR family transcriptional regulator
MANSARRKFFATTRGQIVQLLCSGTQTVTELAERLNVSENAVRAHLAALDREGFVHLTGKRPGTRKPHFAYELTAKAHDLFTKGYEQVLLELLEVLALRYSNEELSAWALEVGQRLVQNHLPKLKRQKPASRLTTLVSKSCEAGIPLNLVHHNGDVILRGCSCPLTSVTKRKPDLCNVVARILSEILEQPVQQQCDHRGAPRCEFRLKALKGFSRGDEWRVRRRR